MIPDPMRESLLDMAALVHRLERLVDRLDRKDPAQDARYRARVGLACPRCDMAKASGVLACPACWAQYVEEGRPADINAFFWIK